jgi:hypothetical protein
MEILHAKETEAPEIYSEITEKYTDRASCKLSRLLIFCFSVSDGNGKILSSS